MSGKDDTLKRLSVQELQNRAFAIQLELDKAVQEFIRLHDQGIEAFAPIAHELRSRGAKVRPVIAKHWSRSVKYAKHPDRYPVK